MTSADRSRASTAADQVSRMLALVPYISRRPGVSISELADEFGVSTVQITKDLNLLMVCGEPGYYPNELIDVVFDDEDGTVAIAYDAGIGRPLRLGPEEAVTLTVALRALAELPDLIDPDAVHSALEKLEHATAGPVPTVEIVPPDPAPALAVVRRAIDEQRRLRLRYYTASRDEITDREVDPNKLLVVNGHTYLEAYCYRAESIRRFRIDRIEDVSLLDAAAQRPLWDDGAVPETLFNPGRDAPAVTLLLAPAAAWVAEYFLVEERGELADRPGWLRVRLRASSDEWLVRLLLSLGGAAEVLDRPELAAMAADRAARALQAYRD